MSQLGFGEYNFSDNSFPITNIFTDCYFLKDRTMLDHECQFKTVPITIGWIINREYFDYAVKIPPEKAEKLINARKQLNGKINRTFQTRIVFTFVNQPYYIQTREFGGSIYNVLEKDGFIIYITKLEFYDNGQLVASLKPNTNFEDPVSGYKKLNGDDIYHMVTKDYEKTLSDNTIVVNRVNGVPAGPVKYYDAHGNLIKTADCSYFFPNKIVYAGDEVKFVEIAGKNIPYSIMQYSNNRIAGYEIHFEQSGNKVQLNTVHKIEESGAKTLLTDPNGWFSHYGGEVNSMPIPVQELIKKYDHDNYFSYSGNKNEPIPVIKKDEEIKISESKTIATTSTDNKILISAVTGTESKKYFAGQSAIYSNKKADKKETGDVLFLFNYKDGKNDNIKSEIKNYIVSQFQGWIEKSIHATPVSLQSLKENTLFKVELIFTVRLFKITSLDAYIDTRIYITKNGELVLDDSFKNSKSLFMDSNEPYTVLNNVITNSEKKISKILEDYMPIN